jgi:hypothetical protein
MSQESKTPQLDALAMILQSSLRRAYDDTEGRIIGASANSIMDKIHADLITGQENAAALEAIKAEQAAKGQQDQEG